MDAAPPLDALPFGDFFNNPDLTRSQYDRLESGKYYYMYENANQNRYYYLIHVDSIPALVFTYKAYRINDAPWAYVPDNEHGIVRYEPLERQWVDANPEDASGMFIYEPVPAHAAIGGRRRYRKRRTMRRHKRASATRRNRREKLKRTRRAH
jgi:hypothetical protein